jgi:metallo-beta-lactamase family protein
MKITVHGAGGGEVTGSAYVVRTRSAKVLVDLGMFQGARKVENHNRLPGRGAVKDLDAVLVTHAHIDHTGRLPLLPRAGYQGPVYASAATIELTSLFLKDSAHLQQADADRMNRRRRREGLPLLEPLYGRDDLDRIEPLFRELALDHGIEIAPGITVRAVEAGHILGSVSLEMTIEDEGVRKVVIFSGDLGPRGAPLHRDPVPFRHADVVFLESTYGDHDHPPLAETARLARDVIRQTVEAGGKVLVPVFAVGRTQLLLYMLAGAFQRGTLPTFPIYIDSPMAIEATRIYARHVELFDEEALAMHDSGELGDQLSTAHFTPTAAESRGLNAADGPCLIMAGAGMCTGGRILHHFRHNLGKPETTVLFVGYQARGSLGRMIVEGRPSIPIHGERIPVRARVHTLGGLSGHAGQSDLLHWLSSMAPSRPRVFLVHGEDGARESLGQAAEDRIGLHVAYPRIGETIEI